MTTTDSDDATASVGRGARVATATGRWINAHRRTALALAVVLALALAAAADWPHKATHGQLQADLESYVTEVRNDVLSCGTEVEDALSAYNQIMAGVSTQRSTAEGIANGAALDCTPSGNAMILDMADLQPPRSLSALNLDVATNQLYGWASSDAVDAMQDLHSLLVHPGDPTTLSHMRSLLADMQQRAAAAQAVFDRAAASVGAPTESLELDAVQPGVLVG